MRRQVMLLGSAIGLGAMGLLSACSTLRPATSDRGDATAGYSGRLSLQLEPSESFQAAFDLQGDARSGQLALSGPTGQTLALLQWAPGESSLLQGGQRRVFASPQALVAEGVGAPLPWEAFFEWLRGEASPAVGWQVDLSRHAEGRIAARRERPGPRVELRVQLLR